MGEADRGVGRVDALPAGAGGAVHVDADVFFRDVDVVDFLDLEQDLDVREGRLPPALVVERRDPHEAVGALFDREGAVDVGAVTLKVADLIPASSA